MTPRTEAQEEAAEPGGDMGPTTEHGAGDVTPAEPARRSSVRAAPPVPVEGEPLFEPTRAGAFRTRWDEIQASFIDDPRSAVMHADELVDEMLRAVGEGFAHQKSALHAVLEREGTEGGSTEELRLALHRYRAFFGRVLGL